MGVDLLAKVSLLGGMLSGGVFCFIGVTGIVWWLMN